MQTEKAKASRPDKQDIEAPGCHGKTIAVLLLSQNARIPRASAGGDARPKEISTVSAASCNVAQPQLSGPGPWFSAKLFCPQLPAAPHEAGNAPPSHLRRPGTPLYSDSDGYKVIGVLRSLGQAPRPEAPTIFRTLAEDSKGSESERTAAVGSVY